MNMANMQRPGGAPMMAPMMTARPGMPPQGMPQVQPNPNVGGPNVRANYKYTAGVRNVAGGQVVPVAPQPVMQPQAPQAAVFIQGMFFTHIYSKISNFFNKKYSIFYIYEASEKVEYEILFCKYSKLFYLFGNLKQQPF